MSIKLCRIKVIFLISFSLFLFSNKILSQPGTLDLSFGDSGKVITSLSSFTDLVRGIVVQPDEKIIVGVSSYNFNFPDSILTRIVRYRPNGLIDSSFGNNGIKIIDDLNCYDLQIKPNRKILVYGDLNHISTRKIVQLNSDGSIDSTFGINGNTVITFNQGSKSGGAGAIALQSNNEILGTTPNLGLVRFKANGVIDSTFGINGITQTDGKIGWGLDSAYQASSTTIVQPDNKILVGGDVSSDGMHFQFAIVRYTTNGFLDSSFGINGRIISTYVQDTSNHNVVSSIGKLAIQSNNKIVCGGGFHNYTTQENRFALARFNIDGVYDSTFGINGKSLLDVFGGANGDLRSFILQKDDKIIATGTILNNNFISSFGLTRYSADGNTDKTFGSGGYTITSFGDTNATPNSIAFQGNRVIDAGSMHSNSSYSIGILRYNNDDVLASSLLLFKATKKQTSVVLNWQTANESNNNFFILEKTNNSNNINWNAIATIQSKGNSVQTQSYTYEDIHPLQGQNFYRLKQVDKDGSFTYSSIVSVDFENGNIIIAYPNPASNILNILGLNPSSSSNLIVEDMKGNTIKTAITNETKYSLNIQDLSKGIYFLKIIQNNKTSAIKFVKK